jgi:hypothetical protein
VIQSQQRVGDVVFASRSGEMPIVGYRKMWLNIANLGDLLADITPHVLRGLAADLDKTSRRLHRCSGASHRSAVWRSRSPRPLVLLGHVSSARDAI